MAVSLASRSTEVNYTGVTVLSRGFGVVWVTACRRSYVDGGRSQTVERSFFMPRRRGNVQLSHHVRSLVLPATD